MLAIILATVLGFVISSVFYAVVSTGAADEAPATRPRPWQLAVELLRSAAVAGLVAGLLAAAGWSGAGDGALLGLALSVLPFVLLTGSVVWERVPVRSAAAHLADWLIKLVAIGAVVGALA